MTAYGAERKLVFGVLGFRFCPKADRRRSALDRWDWAGNADIPLFVQCRKRALTNRYHYWNRDDQ